MFHILAAAFLTLGMSSCSQVGIKEETRKSLAPDSGDSIPGRSSEAIPENASLPNEVVANEPVPVGGAYLSCVAQKIDTKTVYGCALYLASLVRAGLIKEQVESLNFTTDGQQTPIDAVWLPQGSAFDFNFQSELFNPDRSEINLVLKDGSLGPFKSKASPLLKAFVPELLWSQDFETITTTTANDGQFDSARIQAPPADLIVTRIPPPPGGAPSCVRPPNLEIQSGGNGAVGRIPNSYQGSFHAELDALCSANVNGTVNNNTRIAHKEAVKIGHWYKIEFAYMLRAGATKPRFVVDVDGATVIDETTIPATWTLRSYVYQAASSMTIFGFADWGDDADLAKGVLIDAITFSELK